MKIKLFVEYCVYVGGLFFHLLNTSWDKHVMTLCDVTAVNLDQLYFKSILWGYEKKSLLPGGLWVAAKGQTGLEGTQHDF